MTSLRWKPQLSLINKSESPYDQFEVLDMISGHRVGTVDKAIKIGGPDAVAKFTLGTKPVMV
ncbi:MAG TPA: hypothetical protein VN150_05680 [Ochrobactrum sp.]|nr:hypothetical protein [Ochrobactrum sp.]